jgi:hypothetical protein
MGRMVFAEAVGQIREATRRNPIGRFAIGAFACIGARTIVHRRVLRMAKVELAEAVVGTGTMY